MTIDNHSLHNEFPEMAEQIRTLKMKDRHFARLFDEYHEIDKEVRRIEEDVEAASDDRLEGLKMRRLHLKDDLFAMLKEA
ncbi:MAG: GTP-binding protein [Oceanospirillaceae bacterium]|nr:GTP-binding protein [Oceanospirillaceae bacterium]MBT11605.1 GTP-binding protein [Oceanospirillaceae bacterium]|tara:strand:- start:49090 stop:49329 length:240 start_codon:yes stop_codon:yes gene_type:complete